MASIFINYRRTDSGEIIGRIYDHLVFNFKRHRVFKDVDSIELGQDFRKIITNAVQTSEVVLVVIGPKWLETKDNSNRLRLENPDDFVRIELEAALGRNIPVIPILVGGAEMPTIDSLPQSLHPLSFRNAIQIRNDPDFKNDISKLCNALEKMIPRKPLVRSINIPLMIIVLIGIVILVVLAPWEQKTKEVLYPDISSSGDCSEVVFTDYSKFPPEVRKELVCN